MVATDNASYSDMVFGIFKMLGYRFSPRFKDLEDQRFRKAQMPGAEPVSGYGPLEVPARNKVNVKKVLTNWPDMLRVAGSLVTNQVRAYDLLRMLGREGHPTPLGQAFAEYGRTPRLCTCWPSWTRSTTPTAARCMSSSPSRSPVTSSPGTSATARRAPSTRRTGTGWRTSSAWS